MRPSRDIPRYLSRKLLRMFTSPLFVRFSELSEETSSELIENICLHLDPFPELVAITHAISVAMLYGACREPLSADSIYLKPGMTLYLTFIGFEGCAYLTTIDSKPPASCSKMLQVQDELLVCRDHFAIRDIRNSRDPHHHGGMGDQSLFYHTLKVREIGRKASKLGIFSDVCAIRVCR